MLKRSIVRLFVGKAVPGESVNAFPPPLRPVGSSGLPTPGPGAGSPLTSEQLSRAARLPTAFLKGAGGGGGKGGSGGGLPKFTAQDFAVSAVATFLIGFSGYAVVKTSFFNEYFNPETAAPRPAVTTTNDPANRKKLIPKEANPLPPSQGNAVFLWGAERGSATSRISPNLAESLSNTKVTLAKAAFDADGSLLCVSETGHVLYRPAGQDTVALLPLKDVVDVGAVPDLGLCFALTKDGQLHQLSRPGDAVKEAAAASQAEVRTAVAKVELPDGVRKLTSISCGRGHLLGVTDDGRVVALGSNAHGQLGTGAVEKDKGSASSDAAPRLVLAGADLFGGYGSRLRAVAVAAGANHSIVVADSGRAYAFGSDSHMQLGLASAQKWRGGSPGVPKPREVQLHESVSNVVGAAAGDSFTVLRTADGLLISFGRGDAGQLGDGRMKHLGEINVVRPATLGGPAVSAKDVTCGDSHCLLRTENGEVWGWGMNREGQVGSNSRANVPFPIPIIQDTTRPVTAIAAAGTYSFAAVKPKA